MSKFLTLLRTLALALLGLSGSLHGEEGDPPSLHIFLTTIGRPTLINMLDSLAPQLTSRDYLTLVFDARDDGNVFETAQQYVEKLPCTSTVIMEPVNLGFWGHAARNKYQVLPGDFIMHGDDDDIYTPDALSVVRKNCRDPSTLYIFQIILPNGRILTPRGCSECNISTQSGVIPSAYNSQSRWGSRHSGDFDFYSVLFRIVPKIEYIDYIVYIHRPHEPKSASKKPKPKKQKPRHR